MAEIENLTQIVSTSSVYKNLICLQNQKGNKCTVLGKTFILALIDGGLELISICSKEPLESLPWINLKPKTKPKIECRFAWSGQQPKLLDDLEEGCEVCFDAIKLHSSGSYEAMFVWIGNQKPSSVTEPLNSSYILYRKYEHVAVLELQQGDELDFFKFEKDGITRTVAFKKEIANFNISYTDSILLNSLNIFADVCELINSDGGRIYICIAMWIGEKNTEIKISQLTYGKLYSFDSHKNSINVSCGEITHWNLDAHLNCTSNNRFTLNFKIHGRNFVFDSPLSIKLKDDLKNVIYGVNNGNIEIHAKQTWQESKNISQWQIYLLMPKTKNENPITMILKNYFEYFAQSSNNPLNILSSTNKIKNKTLQEYNLESEVMKEENIRLNGKEYIVGLKDSEGSKNTDDIQITVGTRRDKCIKLDSKSTENAVDKKNSSISTESMEIKDKLENKLQKNMPTPSRNQLKESREDEETQLKYLLKPISNCPVTNSNITDCNQNDDMSKWLIDKDNPVRNILPIYGTPNSIIKAKTNFGEPNYFCNVNKKMFNNNGEADDDNELTHTEKNSASQGYGSYCPTPAQKPVGATSSTKLKKTALQCKNKDCEKGIPIKSIIFTNTRISEPDQICESNMVGNTNNNNSTCSKKTVSQELNNQSPPNSPTIGLKFLSEHKFQFINLNMFSETESTLKTCQPSCLTNYEGNIYNVLGKQYVITTIIEELVILAIEDDYFEGNLWNPRLFSYRFLWDNGKPLPFSEFANGTEVLFDAVKQPETLHYNIIAVWKGKKPYFIPQLKNENFILSSERLGIPVRILAYGDSAKYIQFLDGEKIKLCPFDDRLTDISDGDIKELIFSNNVFGNIHTFVGISGNLNEVINVCSYLYQNGSVNKMNDNFKLDFGKRYIRVSSQLMQFDNFSEGLYLDIETNVKISGEICSAAFNIEGKNVELECKLESICSSTELPPEGRINGKIHVYKSWKSVDSHSWNIILINKIKKEADILRKVKKRCREPSFKVTHDKQTNSQVSDMQATEVDIIRHLESDIEKNTGVDNDFVLQSFEFSTPTQNKYAVLNNLDTIEENIFESSFLKSEVIPFLNLPEIEIHEPKKLSKNEEPGNRKLGNTKNTFIEGWYVYEDMSGKPSLKKKENNPLPSNQPINSPPYIVQSNINCKNPGIQPLKNSVSPAVSKKQIDKILKYSKDNFSDKACLPGVLRNWNGTLNTTSHVPIISSVVHSNVISIYASKDGYIFANKKIVNILSFKTATNVRFDAFFDPDEQRYKLTVVWVGTKPSTYEIANKEILYFDIIGVFMGNKEKKFDLRLFKFNFNNIKPTKTKRIFNENGIVKTENLKVGSYILTHLKKNIKNKNYFWEILMLFELTKNVIEILFSSANKLSSNPGLSSVKKGISLSKRDNQIDKINSIWKDLASTFFKILFGKVITNGSEFVKFQYVAAGTDCILIIPNVIFIDTPTEGINNYDGCIIFSTEKGVKFNEPILGWYQKLYNSNSCILINYAHGNVFKNIVLLRNLENDSCFFACLNNEVIKTRGKNKKIQNYFYLVQSFPSIEISSYTVTKEVLLATDDWMLALTVMMLLSKDFEVKMKSLERAVAKGDVL